MCIIYCFGSFWSWPEFDLLAKVFLTLGHLQPSYIVNRNSAFLKLIFPNTRLFFGSYISKLFLRDEICWNQYYVFAFFCWKIVSSSLSDWTNLTSSPEVNSGLLTWVFFAKFDNFLTIRILRRPAFKYCWSKSDPIQTLWQSQSIFHEMVLLAECIDASWGLSAVQFCY